MSSNSTVMSSAAKCAGQVDGHCGLAGAALLVADGYDSHGEHPCLIPMMLQTCNGRNITFGAINLQDPCLRICAIGLLGEDMFCGSNGCAVGENARHPDDRSMQTYISRIVEVIVGQSYSCVIVGVTRTPELSLGGESSIFPLRDARNGRLNSLNCGGVRDCFFPAAERGCHRPALACGQLQVPVYGVLRHVEQGHRLCP